MTSEHRWIIAGARKIRRGDIEEILRQIEEYARLYGRPDLVISGGATGADEVGEQWAEAVGIPVERHPADWSAHGKAAGPIRNQAMAERGTHLLAFPGPKSRGTYDVVRKARAAGLEVLVHEIGGDDE